MQLNLPDEKDPLTQTLKLADFLLEETIKEKSLKESRQEKTFHKLLNSTHGKAFLVSLGDECFRSKDPKKIANTLYHILKKYKIPTLLPISEKIKFSLFLFFGRSFPQLLVPLVQKAIQKEMSKTLLLDEKNNKERYLFTAKKRGVRVNLNHLGEAILGEREAENRIKLYLKDLEDPLVDCISVKVSTLYSQIELIAFDKTLEVLKERLKALYKASNGKLVYLDMEEYKDLRLTWALFKQTLDLSEFKDVAAGIVLQSYIPDSFLILKEIVHWAQIRYQNGGKPIRIRIVKGANLGAEVCESSLQNWELPTFDKKVYADANFKKMVEYLLRDDLLDAIDVGIASHNLFDIAFALVLRSKLNKGHRVGFEMLKGMSEPMQRVIQRVSQGMLVYSPIARLEEFHFAMAYLLRRLDENTGEGHFLKDIFNLTKESSAWKRQRQSFVASLKMIDTIDENPKREMNRYQTKEKKLEESFANESDTDFSIKVNQKWANEIIQTWKEKKIKKIPFVIQGKESEECHEELLRKALQGKETWEISYNERSSILGKAANLFRKKRGDLIGAMLQEGNKTVKEADVEISEAIDFLDYYRKTGKDLFSLKGFAFRPLGKMLVATPWNFPLSIPLSGISSALLAGNTVLFKPAPETPLVGWLLVNILWEAGVPKEILQFIPCDDTFAQFLVMQNEIKALILTGATATAKAILESRPSLHVMAETGGKNAIIITALSDRDLSVKDLLQSAFGHAGQKCSACSLAILEKEVYDDPLFMEQLKDAAESLKVGLPFDPTTKIPPLIRMPEKALQRAINNLDEGESWLCKPFQNPSHPFLYHPGIKLGVKEGSFMHQTELFGPVLGVMRAENLEHAILLANATPYGLTSGIHTLNEEEQKIWSEKIIAGNLYINRSITGAIVRRQPFGGTKASSFGPGAKAGGPNYLSQMVKIEETLSPSEKASLPSSTLPLFTFASSLKLSDEESKILKLSLESYAFFSKEFKTKTDPSKVIGQDNFFFHVPFEKLTLRIEKSDAPLDFLRAIGACLIIGASFEISSSFSLPKFHKTMVVVEDNRTFSERFFEKKHGRVRLFHEPNVELFQAAAKNMVLLISSKVMQSGRFELLHYLREVSLSHTTHRYGLLKP